MSRLDSFIRRMVAQRDILNQIAEKLDVEGVVLELGLGNGRTYDHLREILPDREIFVFERQVNAQKESIPDGDHLIVGEARETLRFCGPRIKQKAALIHNDLGTGDPTMNLAMSAWLSPVVEEHLTPGGYVVSGFPLELSDYTAVPLPDGVREGRYYIYQRPL